MSPAAAPTAAFDPSAIEAAVQALRAGGVIAYPTEGVFGLGCDPRNEAACRRLFALKQRPPGQGVLLIGADFAQLAPWIGDVADAAVARARATWPGAHTWVFPRAADAPAWIAGDKQGIALRMTAHPVAAALCRTFGGVLVSTSANRHGNPPVLSAGQVRAEFGTEVDVVVAGALGGLRRPTPISDAVSGASLRS